MKLAPMIAARIAATLAVATLGCGTAFAQNTTQTPPQSTLGTGSPAGTTSGGTTTGPASTTGHPATLGSSAQQAVTPHQASTLENKPGQKPAQQ